MLSNKSAGHFAFDRVTILSILAGGCSALLAIGQGGAMFSSLGPLLLLAGCLFSFPLFLIGLGFGVRSLGIACFSSILTYAAALLGLGVTALTPVVVMALTQIFPILILCRQALLSRTMDQSHTEWYPTKFLINWLLGIAAVGLLLISIWPEIILPGGAEDILNQLQNAAPHITNNDSEADAFRRVLVVIWPFLPGMVVVSWMLLMVLNGTLAQLFLVHKSINLRPTFNVGELEVDTRQLIVLALSGLAAVLLPGAIQVANFASNLFLVLLVPCFLAGMALIHFLCRVRQQGTLMLGAFYCFMVVFSWIAVLILLLGIFEPWLRLRQLVLKREKY